MMEGIMNEARVTTALPRPGPATKALSMLALVLPSSRRMRSTLLSLGIALTTGGCTQSDRPYLAGGGTSPRFAPILREVLPALVNGSAVQRMTKPAAVRESSRAGYGIDPVSLSGVPPSVLDELLRRFLDERRRRGGPGPKVASVALGPGFIIDPRGYVVTDDHVVENAEAVTVALQDATEYPARIVGRDPPTDLALLKIDGAGALPHVRWGDS